MADMASMATDSLDQAMRSFQDGVQAALKVQQEALKGLQDTFGAATLPVWQKEAQAAVREIVSTAGKNAEDALQTAEQNLKTGMELWQKTVEVQSDKPQPSVQEKALGFWQGMLGVVCTNTEAMLRLNSRTVETWMELGRLANGAHGQGATAGQSV
jgi:hypothetical protein